MWQVVRGADAAALAGGMRESPGVWAVRESAAGPLSCSRPQSSPIAHLATVPASQTGEPCVCANDRYGHQRRCRAERAGLCKASCAIAP